MKKTLKNDIREYICSKKGMKSKNLHVQEDQRSF
jgi:hypothetical protein